MSGVNPLAQSTASAAVTDSTTAILQALAADAQALNALLQEGDVVQATVLPFNGVTDLIDVFGLQVPASLPPGIYPGEQIQLQVQGFADNQIMVKLISVQPGPAGSAGAAAGEALELTPTPVPVVVDPASLPQAPTPPAASGPGAAANPSPPAGPAGTAGPPVGSTANPVVLVPPAGRTPLPEQNAPNAPPAGAPSAESLSVEARLALNRATLLAPQRSMPTQRPPAPSLPTTPPPRPAASQSSAGSLTPGRSSLPPQPPLLATRAAYLPIAARSADKAPPAPIPGAPAPIRGPASTLAAPPGARPAPVVASSLLSDPAALLRTLRIPVSPTSLAFAKLVTTQPEQVATALRALETGLPQGNDPRVQTLRTIATFVGTLDPKSPTFTTQVSSYLSHVAEGPEPKLFAALLQSEVASPDPEQTEAGTTQPGPQPGAAGAPAPNSAAAAQPQTQTPAPPAPVDPAVAAAQAVMRTAAASADLKTQLLSILATPGGPESAVGDAGTALVQNALTALATSQLNSLASQQTQSGAWSFTIPIAIDQQLFSAKVQVDRDAPDAKKPLTGDDFHISFILDTQRLGTVAIDVRAVGRAVTVSVKTEREIAAASFKSSLAQLGERLESMRYNVKTLEAGTLPPRIAENVTEAAEKAEEAPIGPPPDPNAMVDRHA